MRKFFLHIVAFVFFFAKNSYCEPSLIRDSESEKFLRELATPIFKASGLNAKDIKIFIINDDAINAFVSGGQNVFINTGLLRKYNTPDALIGVLAHETGHIAAGHLVRSSEDQKKAGGAALLSYLLGIGAIVAGSPQAGQAIIMGGNQTAQRLSMKFTRDQEEAADLLALRYLDSLKYPPNGLLNLLQFFEQEMIGYQGEVDEYLLSHPVSKKRIDLIKAHLAHKNFSDAAINKNLQPQMDRVLAKLEGFIDNPDRILEIYKNQNDESSNYKKSIALFRRGRVDEALNLLNQIIEKNPKNGFLFETKGEILFESGRISDAIIAYHESAKRVDRRDSALIKISFAMSILSLNKDDFDLINIAIKNLNEAKEYEEDNPILFKSLAIAYAKIKDEGRSLISLAEFNCMIDQKEKCKKYAKQAKEKLAKSDKENLMRADDLLSENEEEKDDKKKR